MRADSRLWPLAAFSTIALAFAACGQTATSQLVGVDDPSQLRPVESTPPPPASHAPKPKPIPAQGGPPVDGSVVPTGSGWYCFDTPQTWMQCERSAQACDDDHSAALDPGIAIGECTQFDSVFAFTKKDDKGDVHLYPYREMSQCLSPVFGRKDAADASGCAELR
jgi:hypothetical protein